MSDVCNDHQLDRYLVMFDESAHSTEGRLERRKPISGLFCNVEEDLRAIDDSLPLCWEIKTVKGLTSRNALNLLTSTRTSVTPRGPGIRRTSLLKHGSAGMIRGGQILRRPRGMIQPWYLGSWRWLMRKSIYSGLYG